MNKFARSAVALGARARSFFITRDVMFHDGRALRRFSVSGRTQAVIAAFGAMTVSLSGYGAAHAAYRTATVTGVVTPTPAGQKMEQMQRQIGAMKAQVTTIQHLAQEHAQRVEQRQALLTAVLTGKGDEQKLAMATLAVEQAPNRTAAAVVDPLLKVEARQAQLAGLAQKLVDRKLAQTNATLRKLGVANRISAKPVAMGGPLIDANSAEAQADLKADAQFRTLFQSWKKLDTLQQGAIAIPSVQPVQHLQFTSNFGIRSDPFRGTAAMHAGVDIPGPVGTPIYATADGIVAHAARQGGYGNMVEINHGKGIATRYGHLSKILVTDGSRVTRGQLIALMGSTGRSTGPHLHYEVRIDGHAVNPIPFLTTADYLLAAQDRAVHVVPVTTDGPAAQD
ncbi:M23 family metallopeptidase [Sphingomonas sp. XXL09]|uniref:M23 family metallopeptidase n=1 Tax=Sphingomonas sp. XXL09 TaxID=3457787 RepID=UPI00406B9DFF